MRSCLQVALPRITHSPRKLLEMTPRRFHSAAHGGCHPLDCLLQTFCELLPFCHTLMVQLLLLCGRINRDLSHPNYRTMLEIVKARMNR